MKTILVAESSDTGRELIRTLLEHSGYSVVEAANSEKLMPLARETNPDLLLLDLNMPIQDGGGVLREFRSEARFQALPIIALVPSAVHGVAALKKGFTAYLEKPLSLAEIRNELARLLDDRPMRDVENTPAA